MQWGPWSPKAVGEVMLSIGEFSRVTELSIKALRLYHEKGILIPNKIDVGSKYRYYQRGAVEKGLVIKKLKDMGFSLDEIRAIVRECSDDRQLVAHVEAKLEEIGRKLRQLETLKGTLSGFLDNTEGESMDFSIQIERESIPVLPVCGIRFEGRYSEVGPRFAALFKGCGRYSLGKPFSLYYDGEYKEEGADIEACLAVKRVVSLEDVEGAEYRELKGGEAVTLVHRGPYHELGRSYMRLYEYCREYGLKVLFPTREQYLKGPGIIFKGNPKRYVTKIIMLYE